MLVSVPLVYRLPLDSSVVCFHTLQDCYTQPFATAGGVQAGNRMVLALP